MIDARKILLNVTLQYMLCNARELMTTQYRFVCAFTHPIGIGIVDETPLPDGFNDVAERMVNYTVAKKGAAEINRRLGSWI